MDQLFSEVDQLFDQDKIKEPYELLDAAGKKDPAAFDNVEFLWRFARSSYVHGKNLPDKKAGKAIVIAGFDYVLKALQLNEGCAEAHKWKGIILDQVGQYDGTKKRIENSHEAEKHFRRALELKPNDAVTLHCLGVWHFEFADLPWLQRKVAALVYAKVPETTYEQALNLFLEAEKVQPGFYSMNWLMIGKCYVRMKKYADAIEPLKKARDWQQTTVDDREAHEEALKLLKDAGYKGN